MSSRKKDKAHRPPYLKEAPSMTALTGEPGPTIVEGGKTWRLGFATQKAKARLENLFREYAVRDATENESPQEAQAVRDMARGGHYRTLEAGWVVMLQSPAGQVLYLLSFLQQHHPDATYADAMRIARKEPQQVQDAMTEISPDFFKAVAREVAAERGLDADEIEKLETVFAEAMAKNFPTK